MFGTKWYKKQNDLKNMSIAEATLIRIEYIYNDIIANSPILESPYYVYLQRRTCGFSIVVSLSINSNYEKEVCLLFDGWETEKENGTISFLKNCSSEYVGSWKNFEALCWEVIKDSHPEWNIRQDVILEISLI